MAVWTRVVGRILLVTLLLSGNTLATGQPQAPLCVPTNPKKIGPVPYQGMGGNSFLYESETGLDGASWHYQVAVTNTGANPLTVDWPKPSYFRRGIPPRTKADGECISDGNPPNQMVDTIRYGPNTQFTGPNAPFFWPAPSSANPHQTSASIKFNSHLGSGQIFVIRVNLDSLSTNDRLIYRFSNTGDRAWIGWGSVMGPMFYSAAKRQLKADSLSPDFGLLVEREATVIVVGNTAKAYRAARTVDIRTPSGLLLYRDIAPAITLDTSFILPK